MAGKSSKLQKILDFDFDQYDDATRKRLCLEVPCVVDLSHCNVVTWLDKELTRKAAGSKKWTDIKKKCDRDINRVLSKRGAQLYAKYLEPDLKSLAHYNRWVMRHMVWTVFRNTKRLRNSETSIATVFDTDDLVLDQGDLLALSIDNRESIPFEFNIDECVTSTQQS